MPDALVLRVVARASERTGDARYNVPFKCKLGMHDWANPVKKRLLHESNPKEKEPWAHKCDALIHYCKGCGKSEIVETCHGHLSKVDGRPIGGPSAKHDILVDGQNPSWMKVI